VRRRRHSVTDVASSYSSNNSRMITRTGRASWVAYMGALERYPLPVKAATGAAIFGTGDLLVQKVAQHSLATPHASKNGPTVVDPLDEVNGPAAPTTPCCPDWQRAGRMAAFGVAANCFLHNWWGVLEPVAARCCCPTTGGPRQRLANTVLKVAADQTFGAGCFNAIFFFQTAMLEGRSVQQAGARVGEQWWPQMQMHWCFWPAFHLWNFHFNQLQLRVFYQNLGVIGWSCVLSRTAQRVSEDNFAPPAEVQAPTT
jgi:hypothetical protein